MLEQRIQQHFIDSADLKYQSAEVLSQPIAAAIQAILACVTSGCKVLACGGTGADAQHFAAHFVGRFERERPGLAALALSNVVQPQGDSASNISHIFARQVRALGQAGDVLLTLCSNDTAPGVREAIAAAHACDMSVVALSGGGGLEVTLRETDVQICVPHTRAARIEEVHILVLHCICDGIDAQLLGEQEPTV